jgi:hypothetical protein
MHAQKPRALPPPCTVLTKIADREGSVFGLHKPCNLWQMPHARRARVFQNPRDTCLRQSVQNLDHGSHDLVTIFQRGQVVGRKKRAVGQAPRLVLGPDDAGPVSRDREGSAGSCDHCSLIPMIPNYLAHLLDNPGLGDVVIGTMHDIDLFDIPTLSPHANCHPADSGEKIQN